MFTIFTKTCLFSSVSCPNFCLTENSGIKGLCSLLLGCQPARNWDILLKERNSYYCPEIFSPTILIFLRNINGFLALVKPGNIIDAEYNLHLRSAYAH